MDEMRKRLRTAMDEENITAKELADKTGFRRRTLCRRADGRRITY